MGDSWEYGLLAGMTVFFGVLFYLLGLVGVGSAQAAEIPTAETWGFIDGLGFLASNPARHFNVNPFTEQYTAAFYILLVLAPVSLIGVLIFANYIRGR